MGRGRSNVPQVRSTVAQQLVKELGMSLTEVARLLGVSISAISSDNAEEYRK